MGKIVLQQSVNEIVYLLWDFPNLWRAMRRKSSIYGILLFCQKGCAPPAAAVVAAGRTAGTRVTRKNKLWIVPVVRGFRGCWHLIGDSRMLCVEATVTMFLEDLLLVP